MDGVRRRVLFGTRNFQLLDGRADRTTASKPSQCRPGGYGKRTLRDFVNGQCASTVIEGAIAISILVAAFAGLMAIVEESYATDRLDRAARAVARAVALNANADPCAAIRREFAYDEDFCCDGQWQISVDLGLSPTALPESLDQDLSDSADGELILVRIGRRDSSIACPVDPNAESVPMMVVAIVRREPEAG